MINRYIAIIKSHISVDKLFFRNILWSGFGYSGRILLQVAYFILLARILGSANFGLYSGVLGLVSVFVPFAAWGSGLILIKHISRDPQEFSIYWGTAMIVTLTVGSLLCLVVFGLGTFIYSPLIAMTLVLPVAIGDLFGIRYAELSGQAFQAFQRLSRTSLIWVLFSSLRLIAVVVLILLPINKTLNIWVFFYMVSGLLSGLISMIWVHKELGKGKLSLRGMHGEWRNGFYFSVSTSASGVYNDLDKTMLSRLSTDVIAGEYSAAYRVLDAVYIPVRAIVMSSFPRFFQTGKNGLKDAARYAGRLIPFTVLISGLAWIGMVLISPLLPRILGADYGLTPKIVIWLGPILFFRSIHNLLANTLTGADYVGLRAAVQIIIALLNLVLNLLWIPVYGWMGAVWSSLVSDGGLVVLLFILIYFLNKKQA
jgi:O-antigen/teichoic acid export membrane protein